MLSQPLRGHAEPSQLDRGEKYGNMFLLYLPSLSDFLLGESSLAISQFICQVWPLWSAVSGRL